ncbi:hypothetical protein KCM76_18310 [Zooshikella marina]|uniref:hypothetical protein n=1 Tax=Zooshikella ganghwensis TaxID=202772 RepID=UPI001BAEE84B|nr:hypothetical protein [Zooshikella ganghwensis]MBU2707955.1 hypothetical protein [Zooshikella ganghwensis]
MSIHEVKDKVINCADRFGYSNSQQISQLEHVFSNCDPQEVFQGLVEVFKEDSNNLSVRQELAGRLLFRTSPKARFDLYTEIKDCLLYFDLSVEHLPFYFVEQCGLDAVKDALKRFQHDSLTEREKESLDSIEFWLGNYEKWKEQQRKKGTPCAPG